MRSRTSNTHAKNNLYLYLDGDIWDVFCQLKTTPIPPPCHCGAVFINVLLDRAFAELICGHNCPLFLIKTRIKL